MENFIYSGEQREKLSPGENVSSHNSIAFLPLINDNFKLIFRNSFLFKMLFLANLFLLLGISNTRAQQNVNFTLYANIIYRLTKYIDWPDDKKSGDFIIGIIGDSPLYEEIKNFTGNKMVGNQKIVIKIFSSSADSYNCQVLFINDDESRNMKKIAIATAGTSTLLISESNGLARKGSCINFVIVDEHLKLEINKENIEQRNLSIATELLSLGILVK